MEENDADSLKKIVDLKNEVIHTPARLAILLFLMPRSKASFPEIQNVLNLTAGNLSSHIKKLVEYQMIVIEKAFIENKPTTLVHITIEGINAITTYANTLKNIVDKFIS